MRRLFDSARKRVVLLALACWLIVLAGLQILPVPYVRLSPGPVFDVLADVEGEPAITITGARVYPTKGVLDMTTVSERGGPYGKLTLFEAFTGWLADDVVVVPTDLLYPPDTSGEDAEERSRNQFSDSQDKARIAALREADLPVESHAWVVTVEPDSPAQRVLKHGDIILSVAGNAVSGPRQVARRIQRAGPDEPVQMRIRRGGEESDVEMVTVANPDDPAKGYLGVTLGVQADSPVDVEFNFDDVGGPSAGLIFSLGIVDKLTADDLVAGRRVAGTGTMDYDGRVGPIGGITQKLAAADADGVELFLAPAANCDEVLAAGQLDLRVVAVETLSEAVDVLAGRATPESCSAEDG